MNQSAFRAELVARAAKMKPKNDTFAFGKHTGRTPEYVADHDPGYLVWFYENVDRAKWPDGLYKAYRDVQDAEEDDDNGDGLDPLDFYGH